MAVAHFLMVCVVTYNKLKMGTANKELSLISYEQTQVFWFFVKEVLVDFSERASSLSKVLRPKRRRPVVATSSPTPQSSTKRGREPSKQN